MYIIIALFEVYNMSAAVGALLLCIYNYVICGYLYTNNNNNVWARHNNHIRSSIVVYK